MAKKQSDKTWIAILIVGLLLIYGAKVGWFDDLFKFSVTNNLPADVQDNLDNSPKGSCSLVLTPQAIFSGDTVTGIIQDGVNTVCNVYATDGSAWRLIYTGTTDSTGRLSSTQPLSVIGTFTFRAICGTCITNEATLIVNELPDEDDEESDGEIYTCTDSDGGINFDVYGNCQDSYHKLGFADVCENGKIKEYYCDDSNICQYIYSESGKCPGDGQMLCGSLWRPSGQPMCTQLGWCDIGQTCTYIPGTSVNPAKCACQ